MPGPYDIYGGQDSTTSRLPMGLGNEGIAGMWPDLLLLGGGTLLSKWGVRTSQGKGMFGAGGLKTGFGLRATAADRKMGTLMSDTMRRSSGTMRHVQESVAGATRRSGTSTYYERYRHRNAAGQFTKGPQLRNKRGQFTSQRASGTQIRKWRSYGTVAGTHMVGTAGHAAARAAARGTAMKGAYMFQAGKMARGAGLALGGMQVFAMFSDMARGVGQAAVDYSPRRPHYSGTQGFGEFFIDPRGAYTQRQRAMAAIHDSQLTSRAAIGGEAAFMHR